MDSFDNFQYNDGASSYGPMGIVDDNSSVYTSNTRDDTASVDLSSLALSEYNPGTGSGSGHHHQHPPLQLGGPRTGPLEEDFDAVLDDLKDEAAVDLPAHACR